MRRVGAGLALAVTLSAAAPLRAADTVTQRLDNLERRVAHLEAVVAAEQNRATEPVTLTSWSAVFAQNPLSKSYRITYRLQNHCDKWIKIIDGSLEFDGPDGKPIYGIPLTGEAALAPGGAASFSGTYFLNPARPEEIELRDLPPSGISTRLRLRRIVFRDNTVLPLE